MNRYLTLTKSFIAAIGMSEAPDKRRKRMIIFLSIFAIFGVLLPVCFATGLLINLMTQTLIPLNAGDKGIHLMMQVITLFTLVFGINVIFNEFYFSNDIEYLLPWPLTASQIIASKFTAAFVNENMMQFFLVASCVVGYGIAARMNVLCWILAVFGIITIPLLPLVYCAIASMLIMAFTRFIKSKDIIQRVSVAIMFAFLVAFVGSIGFLKGMDIDSYVETLASGTHPFFNVMNYIFPTVPLFIKTFTQGSLLALLEYILVNAVAILIMIGLSELLYFKGVIGLTSANNTKKGADVEKVLAKCKQKSPAYSYFMKELRILVRTPVFFTNCIAINFVWPLFLYAAYKIQSRTISLSKMQEMYANKDLRIQLFFLLGVVGISVINSALSSLSSNALSREGKHFSFMKYIPISYKDQWNIKVSIGIIFPLLGVWIYYIPACILVKMPILQIIVFLILSLMAVSFVAFLGIYIDSIQPKLIWDDELSALRENYNTFFSMAISIAFTLIVCVGGFFLFCNTKLSIMETALILFVILTVANIIALHFTNESGVRNIEEQEEA